MLTCCAKRRSSSETGGCSYSQDTLGPGRNPRWCSLWRTGMWGTTQERMRRSEKWEELQTLTYSNIPTWHWNDNDQILKNIWPKYSGIRASLLKAFKKWLNTCLYAQACARAPKERRTAKFWSSPWTVRTVEFVFPPKLLLFLCYWWKGLSWFQYNSKFQDIK